MDKRGAYRSVRTAINNGALIRPANCSRCNAADTKQASGRHTIQAHHEDYNRPLDVEWLCAKCHRVETPLPLKIGAPTFGEQNGAAKLSQAAVEEIRNSAESGPILARRYGVSRWAVNLARRGKTWSAASPNQEAQRG